MFKVRFHLGAGEHFMHWQIVRKGQKSSTAQYFDPAHHQLELFGCTLVNKVNKAKKVHKAGKKDVAGWVECEQVAVTRKGERDIFPVDNLERLRYNPIVDPHWRRDGDAGEFVWDGYKFDQLLTNGRSVYVCMEEGCYA